MAAHELSDTAVHAAQTLQGLGFTMRRAVGETNHDFGELEAEAVGQRPVGGRVALEAFVGSYLWRIGSRRLILVVRVSGLAWPGAVQLKHGELDWSLGSFLSSVNGVPRQHVGDAQLEARYGIHAASLEDAKRALPGALRAVLTAAPVAAHVQITTDHVSVYPTFEALQPYTETVTQAVRFAEAIARVVG